MNYENEKRLRALTGAITDIVLAAVILLVFAYFHHGRMYLLGRGFVEAPPRRRSHGRRSGAARRPKRKARTKRWSPTAVYRRDDRTDGKLLPQRQCQRELDAARGPLERRARRILCRGYLAALERVSAHGVCDERLPERTRYGRRIQRHSRHRRRLCLLAGIRAHRAQRSVPPRHGI